MSFLNADRISSKALRASTDMDLHKQKIRWGLFLGCNCLGPAKQRSVDTSRVRVAAIFSSLTVCWMLALLFVTKTSAEMKPKTQLTVNVMLTSGARGDLGYLIFDSFSGFPGDRDKAMVHGFLPISTGARHLRILADLAPGDYAVSVYEDLNGNHKLDHNFLGLPREPVGASNNPPARLGPPRFGECSFHLGEHPKQITIVMVRGL
ncbi:MAG: DUF2141 domain-containing protein [Acidobacteriota bacterium]